VRVTLSFMAHLTTWQCHQQLNKSVRQSTNKCTEVCWSRGPLPVASTSTGPHRDRKWLLTNSGSFKSTWQAFSLRSYLKKNIYTRNRPTNWRECIMHRLRSCWSSVFEEWGLVVKSLEVWCSIASIWPLSRLFLKKHPLNPTIIVRLRGQTLLFV
jgi:hypothetical protein